uniref:Ig-like domain-containing protein n=1 Tax=Kryptolebias marmoratus TaxID=37003 RepID=A0A3Q3B7D2_KRYMA
MKKFTNIQAVMGSEVMMECNVDGSLPFFAEWRKGKQVITEGSKYKLLQTGRTISLKLKLSESSDTGAYSCKVMNKAGSCVCSGVLTAKVAPRFSAELQPQNVTPNSDVIFRGRVSGSQPLTITWYKDDKKISDRRELKSSDNTKVTFVGGTASLEISSVSRTDAGDYLCKASNSTGSDFCKSKVTSLTCGVCGSSVGLLTEQYCDEHFCLNRVNLPDCLMILFVVYSQQNFTFQEKVCTFEPTTGYCLTRYHRLQL